MVLSSYEETLLKKSAVFNGWSHLAVAGVIISSESHQVAYPAKAIEQSLQYLHMIRPSTGTAPDHNARI